MFRSMRHVEKNRAKRKNNREHFIAETVNECVGRMQRGLESMINDAKSDEQRARLEFKHGAVAEVGEIVRREYEVAVFGEGFHSSLPVKTLPQNMDELDARMKAAKAKINSQVPQIEIDGVKLGDILANSAPMIAEQAYRDIMLWAVKTLKIPGQIPNRP